MQAMYVDDLRHATEIVLSARQRVRSINPPPARPRRERGTKRISRATAGALGIGSAVGAAAASRRPLGPAEAKVLGGAGLLVLALMVVGLWWPRVIVTPLCVVGAWVAVSLLIMAFRLHRRAPGAGPVSPVSAVAERARRHGADMPSARPQSTGARTEDDD